jgi:hypothetical protein
VQVGLHHHREQRLIDPAAPFQQRGEERPGLQLGNPQLQVTGRGPQQPGPVSVALRQSGIGALMWGGANHLGEFGFMRAW